MFFQTDKLPRDPSVGEGVMEFQFHASPRVNLNGLVAIKMNPTKD